jgi:hypothetical protein
MSRGTLGIVLSLSLALAGCRVCSGVCKKSQGRVVSNVEAASDGSLTVTSCDLVTNNKGASTERCTELDLPAPAAGGTP